MLWAITRENPLIHSRPSSVSRTCSALLTTAAPFTLSFSSLRRGNASSARSFPTLDSPLRKKLFPASAGCTIAGSKRVKCPIPGNTRFLRIAVDVAEAESRRIREDSKADCPEAAHNLSIWFRLKLRPQGYRAPYRSWRSYLLVLLSGCALQLSTQNQVLFKHMTHWIAVVACSMSCDSDTLMVIDVVDERATAWLSNGWAEETRLDAHIHSRVTLSRSGDAICHKSSPLNHCTHSLSRSFKFLLTTNSNDYHHRCHPRPYRTLHKSKWMRRVSTENWLPNYWRSLGGRRQLILSSNTMMSSFVPLSANSVSLSRSCSLPLINKKHSTQTEMAWEITHWHLLFSFIKLPSCGTSDASSHTTTIGSNVLKNYTGMSEAHYLSYCRHTLIQLGQGTAHLCLHHPATFVPSCLRMKSISCVLIARPSSLSALVCLPRKKWTCSLKSQNHLKTSTFLSVLFWIVASSKPKLAQLTSNEDNDFSFDAQMLNTSLYRDI